MFNIKKLQGVESDTVSQLKKALNEKKRIICVYHSNSVEPYVTDFKKVDFTNVFETQTLPQYFTQDSETLTVLFFSLMKLQYDQSMWLSRSLSLLSVVISAMVYQRDSKGLAFDARAILHQLDIDCLEELKNDATLPKHVSQALRMYLNNLPGYGMPQNPSAKEQHTFIKSMIYSVFTALGYQYNLFFSHTPSIDYEQLYSGQDNLLFKHSPQDKFPYFFIKSLLNDVKSACVIIEE